MVVIAVVPLARLTTALTVPWFLRRSASALAHVPRLAALALTASVLAWPLALLSIGPLLAWVSTGPVLLPGRAGEVCQQCLAAANPWGQPAAVYTGEIGRASCRERGWSAAGGGGRRKRRRREAWAGAQQECAR